MSEGKGCLYAELTPADGDAGMLSLENPEGQDLLITRFAIVTTEAADGATTVDAGIDNDGTGSVDTLLDGQTINAVGFRDNIKDQDTNGQEAILWESDEYITVTKVAGAGDSEEGLVAKAYIEFIRV